MSLIDEEHIEVGGEFVGSFEFGDISHLIPSLHPFIGGVEGNLHTRDFKIEDPYLAYIVPAKDEYIDFLFSVTKKIVE